MESAASLPSSLGRWTLVASILGSSMAFVDGSVVNVALKAIEHDLGGGLASQQWVVDAYLLTLGSLILAILARRLPWHKPRNSPNERKRFRR